MGAAANEGAQRVRVWRALKTLGVAVVRDGIYLAPNLNGVAAELEGHRQAINAAGGTAFILGGTWTAESGGFEAIFVGLREESLTAPHS